MPSAALSALIGPVRLSPKDRRDLVTIYIPWALRSAAQSIELMSYPYEQNLDQSLEIVRRQLNVEPAPRIRLP